MIETLRLERFKCFTDLKLPLRTLSVFTGLNGAGKSSAIHALLLLRHAASGQLKEIELNGPFGLAMGEASDVLTTDADSKDRVVISTVEEAETYVWRFGVGRPGERQPFLSLDDSPVNPSPILSSRRPRQFTYLCAERLGPRDTLVASSENAQELSVGFAGQHTAQVLATCGSNSISPRRCEPGHATLGINKLQQQTEWWLSEMVREVQIDAQWYPGTNALSLRFRSPGIQSEWTRPANTGFGVSYALPIVVSGLVAAPGGILIVENPEAHLHPAGQSAIGMFLARIAGDGVQVIIETHSDHIINGVRLGVANQLISSTDVVVNFFGNNIAGVPDVIPIRVNEVGSLSSWPRGFFDQMEMDLAILAKVPRRGER